GVPLEAEKRSYFAALGVGVGNGVFVAGFNPIEAAQVAEAEPDVHEIGVVFGGAIEGEEVHVGGVEHDVEEEATDDDVARVAQGDDDLEAGEDAQEGVEGHGEGGVFVEQGARA